MQLLPSVDRNLSTRLALSLVLALNVALISALDHATGASFVVGYLYSGPILLAFWQFSRRVGYAVTTLTCVATLLSFWSSEPAFLSASTVVNRGIAILALAITGYLSDGNRRYEKVLRTSQAQLAAQTQLVKVREDFIATLTHDLRTPILGAVATLRHLREDFEQLSPDHVQRALAVLDRGCRGQLQLIETLLEIYRTENVGLTLKPTSFDLATLITATMATLHDLAERRAIHLTYAGPAKANLYADGVQLQRVLSNLLINSLNHTPKGGEVVITLSDASERGDTSRCVLTVSDTGRGLQSADLSQLFERFYQGPGKRQLPGTGLGLYLSRQIVEAHSGQIRAESRPTGGVTFTVELPHDSRCSSPAG